MAKSALAEDITGSTTTEAVPKKRTVNRGARGPQAVYVFVKTGDDGKLAIVKSFRDPRKMALYFATAQANNEQFLVTTPE